MSNSILVCPVDEQMLDWARKCDVPLPLSISHGRAATIDELLEAARTVPGHAV